MKSVRLWLAAILVGIGLVAAGGGVANAAPITCTAYAASPNGTYAVCTAKTGTPSALHHIKLTIQCYAEQPVTRTLLWTPPQYSPWRYSTPSYYCRTYIERINYYVNWD